MLSAVALSGSRYARLLTAILVSSLIAAVKLPDIATGVIDGRVAVMLFPRFGKDLVEPVGCTAHLVRRDDTEVLFPCGKWFQPPVGRYRVWIEQNDLISPLQQLLVYGGGPFQGRGLGVVMDVVLGGNVSLPSDVKTAADDRLFLFHLDSHRRLNTMGRSFERTVFGSKVRDPVLMPEGRVIIAITDRLGNAKALTRPISVPPRGTVSVAPRPPQEGSDVLVLLTRARTYTTRYPDEIGVTVHAGGRSYDPDVFVTAGDRYYAVWYGIKASRARIELTSETVALPPEEVNLVPGAVSTLIRTVKVLPNLHISLRMPASSFEDEKRMIDILGEGQKTLRHFELSGTEETIESLPAEHLRVALTMGQWRFVRDVDLSSFDDGDVAFDLQPIIVSGKVFRGEHPARGELKFYVGPKWVDTTTDDDGQYRMTLWEPRSYPVEIHLRGEKTPFREYFVELLSSQIRDFRVPDTQYAVRVTDAISGAPVASAEVASINEFRDSEDRPQQAMQKAQTGSDGRAELPPLRAGSVGVVVRAKGYRDSEPVTIPVDQETGSRLVAIRLQPETDTDLLALQLPSGAPGADAAVIAIPAGGGGDVIWQSTSSADGTLTIPKTVRGSVLLIKHPNAAALVRTWDGLVQATWQLSNPMVPLSVKVVDAAGDPCPFADVILWVDGIALRGNALRFLTEVPAVSARDGYWRAHGLPAQTIEVVALRRFRPPAIRALAQSLSVPWANPVVLRVIE